MAKKVQQPDKSGKPKSDTLTPAVAAISDLQFQGAVIPHSWWQSDRLRYDSGRANVIAALILADICYWYRATEARERKFRSDKLQKSYKEWADQFGLTKRQVQDAVAFLADRGLITREMRTFEVAGRRLGNVTFFEPVVDAIKSITFDTLSRSTVAPLTFKSDPSHVQTGEGIRQNVIPITFKRETNTENTTETNPENRQRVASEEPKDMSGAVAPAVQEVFTYWQNQLNHLQAKLTPKRKRYVQARLKEKYTVEQLKSAIDGCRASPWHMGQNPNGTVWDDLALICRDGEHVEMFIANVGSNGKPDTTKPSTRLTTEELGIRTPRQL